VKEEVPRGTTSDFKNPSKRRAKRIKQKGEQMSRGLEGPGSGPPRGLEKKKKKRLGWAS